ncbi:putative F-box domain-containing protein [Tanacetum coccineum]
MEYLPHDVLEMVLMGLDVNDLIQCKYVCKSWNSIISSLHFAKAHLNHSYNNDRNDRKLRHRRIVMCDSRYFQLVGSSNGLVCFVGYDNEFLVANPYTKEVKKVKKPHVVGGKRSLCWGFGYDSSIDDYKVVVGFTKREVRTCFKVLSLKSNVWKVVGELQYVFSDRDGVNKIGMLCNDALHWFMNDQINNKDAIISFELSREEFREISQPDDQRYEFTFNSRLGIVDECLCIYECRWPVSKKWVMKNYSGKKTWKLLSNVGMMDSDKIHYLKDYIPHKNSICHGWDHIGDPVYVQSLVSPRVNGTLSKKECQRWVIAMIFYTLGTLNTLLVS